MTAKKGFDRSKFKAPSMASQTKKFNEIKKLVRSRDGRKGYHDIDEGKNVFRIAPPHDASIGVALEPKCVTFLPYDVEDEEKGGTKRINKALFNARIHGGLTKDPVEMYIDYVYKMLAEEHSDKKQIKKLMAPISGYKNRSGAWVSGIRPSLTWVGYAWKGDTLGRLELRDSIVKKMEELSIDEESDEAIQTDPFSDPEEGVKVIIVYDKSEDMRSRYKVNRGIKADRLSDEQLKELDEQEPLASMFRDKYHMGTFNMQIEALQIFDEENEYGIFDMQEFLDDIEEFKAQVPPEPEKDEEGEDEKPKKTNTTKAKVNKKVEKEEEEEEDVSIEDMGRDDLIAFAEANDIEIDDEDSTKAIRSFIQDALGGSDDDPEDGEAEEVTETEEEEETPAPKAVAKTVKKDTVKTGASSRIEQMRANMKKKD